MNKSTMKEKHVLVCTWSPNEKWKGLSDVEKREFLTAVAVSAASAKKGGMDILGWGALDRAVSNPAPQSFCGIFAVDNRDSLHAVDQAIELCGWYEYFDHVNVGAQLHGQNGIEATDALCNLLGVM
ncbi:MAG: hypothetical protein HOI01_04335 [Proteobacteria bacterium]|nr:hypothetical protein [Pseudomonadota bacterium]